MRPAARTSPSGGLNNNTPHTSLQPELAQTRHRGAHAFVGTRGENAAEYHDNDFPWETLCPDGEEAIQRQQLEVSTARADPDAKTQDGHDWEDFHAQHSLGRFFKEKRYLPIEFPQLRIPNITIGEVGCGCGSALIPVLRDKPTATAVACDVSGTAIQVFRDAALPGAGIDLHRVRLSVNDFPRTSPFEDESLDVAMIIFTLSAFHPMDMERVVGAVRRGLKPGGLVLVRDYGLYDMAQVRSRRKVSRYNSLTFVMPRRPNTRSSDSTAASSSTLTTSSTAASTAPSRTSLRSTPSPTSSKPRGSGPKRQSTARYPSETRKRTSP